MLKNKLVDKNIWIENNQRHINTIIDTLLNILETNKNKYNYSINHTNIIKELVQYIYDTSDNKYIC